MQKSIHLPNFHQAASESVVIMLLDVKTVVAEEVDVLMAEVLAEDAEEEVDKVEEYTTDEVVEEAAEHKKMELIYQMSPVTLKIQSGPHSQTIHEKISPRTRYAQSSWPIKRGSPLAL